MSEIKTKFYDEVYERAIHITRYPLALFATCLLCNRRTDSISLHHMDPKPQHEKGCPLETTAEVSNKQRAVDDLIKRAWERVGNPDVSVSEMTSVAADTIVALKADLEAWRKGRPTNTEVLARELIALLPVTTEELIKMRADNKTIFNKRWTPVKDDVEADAYNRQVHAITTCLISLRELFT